ncbi:MAG: 4Fe-4S binding protein [Pyramidobacter sp.]|nr:4Fe-4S binding protein [Pyramidobacter sp.]
MIRKIVKIDREKCNGCGACASACHEGAIGMVGGKAVLLRDDYCDGLGACLPSCPTGAISFEEREAAAFDESAVKANLERARSHISPPCGCPGTHARRIGRAEHAQSESQPSSLRQWPVQIKLVPARAAYLDGADLLVAADCTAYAYGAFHRDFIEGRTVLVGCPKLDACDYAEKLAAVLAENDIKSLTVVRMEVPCCGGIESAALRALAASGKTIPHRVVIVTVDGRIKD